MIPNRDKRFSLLHRMQTVLGDPTFFWGGPPGFFLSQCIASAVPPCVPTRVEADHCPLSNAEAKNEWSLRFCHPYALTAWRSVNLLTPNDQFMGLTAPLTSKRCILYIYSTNIGTEYFKHALYSPFFLFKMQFVS